MFKKLGQFCVGDGVDGWRVEVEDAWDGLSVELLFELELEPELEAAAL